MLDRDAAPLRRGDASSQKPPGSAEDVTLTCAARLYRGTLNSDLLRVPSSTWDQLAKFAARPSCATGCQAAQAQPQGPVRLHFFVDELVDVPGRTFSAPSKTSLIKTPPGPAVRDQPSLSRPSRPTSTHSGSRSVHGALAPATHQLAKSTTTSTHLRHHAFLQAQNEPSLLSRVAGSIGFGGTARWVGSCSYATRPTDKENTDRVVVHTKSNWRHKAGVR